MSSRNNVVLIIGGTVVKMYAYWIMDYREAYGIHMTTRRSIIKDDTPFWAVKLLQDMPVGITQRALAKEVG